MRTMGRAKCADGHAQVVTVDDKGGSTAALGIRKRIRDIEEASDGSLWMLEDANPGGLFQSIWEKRKGDCHACRTHIA
jgi:glucose/arabinose dehydrogenase